MLLFSRLRRLALPDSRGRRARLFDFSVELPPEGYPPVTHILFRHKSHLPEVLAWDAVLKLDHSSQQIKVKDIEAGELAPGEWLGKKGALSAIHDALGVCLTTQRPARTN